MFRLIYQISIHEYVCLELLKYQYQACGSEIEENDPLETILTACFVLAIIVPGP